MITKILLSVDDSQYAQNNLEYVVTLAKKTNANVTVLHVVSLPSVLAPEAYIDPEPFIEAGEKFLNDLKQKGEGKGVPIETKLEVSYGNPAHKIIEYAKANNFDLIALGARGKSAVRTLLLGSVADTVTRNATCPVLVIR